jgi:hypothetical protein
MAMAFGLLGGLVASQGPEFAQQYRQRLGGAIDELGRVVRQFDADAQATGQDRNGALGQLRSNPDRIASLQGEAMRGNIERLDRLQRQREAFTTAAPFERLVVMMRQADTDIASAAYRDFEPAVPATNEGILSAVIGFLAGWGIARLIGIPLRRVFVRRRRRFRAEPI